MMNCCCEQFKWLLADAGNAGLSLVFRSIGENTGLFLQGRVCDAKQEEKLVALLQDTELPQPCRLTVQQGIRFCPFCGTSAQDVIEQLGDKVVSDLVSKHKEYEFGG